MKKSYGKFVAIGLALAVVAFAGNAEATVQGPCADCHTMHNSQNGAGDPLNGVTPRGALVKGGCAGCHSGGDGAVAIGGSANNIPIIYRTVANPTVYLAGGDFKFALQDQKKGHNCLSVPTMANDTTLGKTPPGFVLGRGPAGGTAAPNFADGTGLTCAGTYGCHGDHAAGMDDFKAVSGAHHETGTITGGTVGRSYRFLLGVTGVEDNDWESETAVDHNVYKAVARDLDHEMDTSTISYLCGECHGNFHAGDGQIATNVSNWNTVGTASPWLRHPTDFDLNKANQRVGGDDYDAYTYSVLAPVGTTSPDLVASDDDLAASVAGQAIVTCISCHRAHGTPNDDLLRWDYATCSSGTDNAACGCFVCHTAKDAGA